MIKETEISAHNFQLDSIKLIEMIKMIKSNHKQNVDNHLWFTLVDEGNSNKFE